MKSTWCNLGHQIGGDHILRFWPFCPFPQPLWVFGEIIPTPGGKLRPRLNHPIISTYLKSFNSSRFVIYREISCSYSLKEAAKGTSPNWRNKNKIENIPLPPFLPPPKKNIFFYQSIQWYLKFWLWHLKRIGWL